MQADINIISGCLQSSETKREVVAKLSPNLNLCLAELHTLLYKSEKKLTALAEETNDEFLLSVNRVTRDICGKLRVFDAVSPAGFHQYDEAAKTRAMSLANMNPKVSLKLPPPISNNDHSFPVDSPDLYFEEE